MGGTCNMHAENEKWILVEKPHKKTAFGKCKRKLEDNI
jgi:hypothetical protein